LTVVLRIFRYSIDDDQENNLEDRLFPLLLVVVVSFNLSAATGRWWQLRRRVSCTVAVPNSWNLVLQNPQLWILYTLSLETYALIPVFKKIKINKIRLRGYAHKQQKKPRTQDFTWFSKSLHPRSAPALNSHYEMNTTVKNYHTTLTISHFFTWHSTPHLDTYNEKTI